MHITEERKAFVSFVLYKKQMNFCCGQEEKRAVFPQEPIPAAGLLCNSSERASLAEKTDGCISVQAERNYFINIIILPDGTEAHGVFQRIP